MNRGELQGVRILEGSSYELLWTPAVRVGIRDYLPVDVGLSWFLSDFGGYQTVFHRRGDK